MKKEVIKISNNTPFYVSGLMFLLQSLVSTKLVTLHEEFDSADRPWISEISRDIRNWFGTQKFVGRCLNGEIEAIVGVALGFWPFVRQFPDQIGRICHKVAHEETRRRRLGRGVYKGIGGACRLAINIVELPSFKKNILKLLDAPEGTHAVLWEKQIALIGYDPNDTSFNKPHPKIKIIIDTMEDDSCTWAWFIRLIVVEMVAQSVGNIMARSEKIIHNLGGKVDWLEVHEDNKCWEPHVLIPERMAVMCGDPKRENVEKVMWDFIYQFADAANSLSNSDTQDS